MDKALDTPRVKDRKPRGKHPDRRLTPLRIKHLKGSTRIADGNGLYLFVDESGAKRWVWRGVIKGKRCDLGLGSAKLVTLKEAREEAIRLKKIARADGDPLAERRRQRVKVPTFKALTTEVHTEHSVTFKNAKHKAQWLASLQADIFPAIGDQAVNTISSDDVRKALSPIWTKKPETARRLKQRIKLVFDYAKVQGHYTGDNPTDGLTKVLPKHDGGEKQHHAALPYQAVPTFIATLRTADTEEIIRLAFELLILTASRTNEVLRATWPEVDLVGKVWTIPGVRMKAGREHRVPLSARAVEIFTRAQAAADGSPWVFPGRRREKPLSNMAFLMVLRRLKQDTITTHGFRSSFRDWTAEKTSVPREVCEAALAHTLSDKTEAAYNRTDLFDRRRKLMDAWTKYATAKPADVVSIGA